MGGNPKSDSDIRLDRTLEACRGTTQKSRSDGMRGKIPEKQQNENENDSNGF
ncbi:hypothetical protein B2J93_6656 [Marssonina coronariae]|uniref:Uncharacterized protein n=1 Tax=Diplocarpon coronariae TaxID=2795749 RepID=A0A218ZIM6_9HELO|nr:hypothetical protein B2J93_6656 [Marssonina coronariae]